MSDDSEISTLEAFEQRIQGSHLLDAADPKVIDEPETPKAEREPITDYEAGMERMLGPDEAPEQEAEPERPYLPPGEDDQLFSADEIPHLVEFQRRVDAHAQDGQMWLEAWQTVSSWPQTPERDAHLLRLRAEGERIQERDRAFEQAHAELAAEIQNRRHARATAKSERDLGTIKGEFKGFDPDTAMAFALANGYSKAELQNIDAREWRMLELARIGHEARANQKPVRVRQGTQQSSLDKRIAEARRDHKEKGTATTGARLLDLRKMQKAAKRKQPVRIRRIS